MSYIYTLVQTIISGSVQTSQSSCAYGNAGIIIRPGTNLKYRSNLPWINRRVSSVVKTDAAVPPPPPNRRIIHLELLLLLWMVENRGRVQLENFGLCFGLKNSMRFYFCFWDIAKLLMSPISKVQGPPVNSAAGLAVRNWTNKRNWDNWTIKRVILLHESPFWTRQILNY